LKLGTDRADRRSGHGISHEILSAREVRTVSDRNQGNLCTCNHTLH